ncbi:glycosyltransferase family 50 protein [Gigaspora margarita]|uniref:GPI mannosyltransferase 1 n=1 Tax=Gigaspora margarita TaxID=4874 RepID=A0A8H4A165_GIGMA|nr:glycosyltransferase family 50 protein [Gigaspora margarita]
MSISKLSITFISIIAVVLRLTMLVYGEWQDANMQVKYTDVDYKVFSDAARFVTLGESPYKRSTYRYTPLLAFLLTPNIYIHKSFGKFVFILADIVVGVLIHKILCLRGLNEQKAVNYSALWLLNPIVASISTRGNAESLLGAMVLLTLYCIFVKKFFFASILYGLSVHFKIYPIIYALPLLVFLDEEDYQGLRRKGKGKEHDKNSWRYWVGKISRFVTPARIEFALISGSVFFVLNGIMYLLGSLLGLVLFIPQISLVALLGVVFGKDILFACFIQTFAFVAYNKVCTSQYFMWYICLFPLIIHSTTIKFKYKGLLMLFAWISGQAIWLYQAYLLEFLGENTFLRIWMASIAFFVINIWILTEIVKNHNYEKCFELGKIRNVWGNSGDVKDDKQQR